MQLYSIVIIIVVIVMLFVSTNAEGQLVTSTSIRTSTSTETITGGNPYWNSNSQKIADYLVKYGWNPQLGLFTDTESGCTDYVGKYPCNDTAWTTSNNVPLCWTMGDYNYSNIMTTCEKTLISLGAFTSPRDGERYEVFTGEYAIVTGNPQDVHTILQPSENDIRCPQTNCPGHSYGILLNGKPYAIQADEYSGCCKGNPSLTASVDILAPQAIMAWLSGNLTEGIKLADNLNDRWNGLGVGIDSASGSCSGKYSTWQLGQVMLVQRVYGLDNSSQFSSEVKQLWELLGSNSFLPNCYTASGPGSGHDPENQDAALLPFSASVIDTIKANFGAFKN